MIGSDRDHGRHSVGSKNWRKGAAVARIVEAGRRGADRSHLGTVGKHWHVVDPTRVKATQD